MNNKDFMKQSAESMSVSELAEAIKIKSVQSTNENYKKRGIIRVSKVESFRSGINNSEFLYIEDNKVYYKTKEGSVDWFSKAWIDDGITIEKDEEKPKAEWIDITNKCEFRLGADVSGTYHLGVYYEGTHIAYAISSACISHPLEIVPTERKKYKVEDIA